MQRQGEVVSRDGSQMVGQVNSPWPGMVENGSIPQLRPSLLRLQSASMSVSSSPLEQSHTPQQASDGGGDVQSSPALASDLTESADEQIQRHRASASASSTPGQSQSQLGLSGQPAPPAPCPPWWNSRSGVNGSLTFTPGSFGTRLSFWPTRSTTRLPTTLLPNCSTWKRRTPTGMSNSISTPPAALCRAGH